jgi:NTE family protein
VTFSNGDDLVDAVVASCSIPIIFYPQLIHGVPYVDGGLLKNFPVSVIRKKCKNVIGINVSLIIPPSEKNNIRTMLERTFNLMSNANTLFDKTYCDILIETKGIEKYSMFNLHNQETIMEAGYHYASMVMSEKRSLELVKKCHRHDELTEKVRSKLQRFTLRNSSQY